MNREQTKHNTEVVLSRIDANWPSFCVGLLASRSAVNPNSEPGEQDFAQAMAQIDQCYYKNHPDLVTDLIAVTKNKNLSDATRVQAIWIIAKLADPDPGVRATRIALAETSMTNRAGVSYRRDTRALIGFADSRGESDYFMREATRALDHFEGRAPLEQRTQVLTLALGSLSLHKLGKF